MNIFEMQILCLNLVVRINPSSVPERIHKISRDPVPVRSVYFMTFLELWVPLCGVYFLKKFWKTFKYEDFGFKIFEKGQILMPYLGLAPSKLKNFKGRGIV